MIEVLNKVIPIFLIIALGFAIGKKRKIDVQLIIDIIVYIAAPCLIFSSISRSNISPNDFIVIALAATAIIILLGFAVFIILKLTKSNAKGLYLPMTIGNTGFIGYPVALFAFGAEGLSRAIIFDMTGSLFLFSIGIYIAQGRNEIKEIFRIPLFYAVVVGILFNIFKISVPDIIFKPIEMISGIAIPAALLVLGYKLTEIKLKSMNTAVLASVFKIGFGIFAAVLITSILSVTGLTKNIVILQASMPSAVMSMIICQKYKRDAELVASIVFISTLISVITIPLIIYAL